MGLKYRISNIGWYNFELLVQTLLKAVIGPGVTSFWGVKRSKDRGRDAGFEGAATFPGPDCQWNGNWVFQVKYVEFRSRKVHVLELAVAKAYSLKFCSCESTVGERHTDKDDVSKFRIKKRSTFKRCYVSGGTYMLQSICRVFV